MADHPVAKGVLSEIGNDTTGSKVRAALMAAPDGWPKDAINAALLGLCAEGHLKAERSGSLVRARDLTQQTIRTPHSPPE